MSGDTFTTEYDISYVAPNLPVPGNRQWIAHYLASVLVYSALLAFLWLNAWFGEMLEVSLAGLSAKGLLGWLLLGYVVIAPPVYLLFRPASLWESKPIYALTYLKRAAGAMFHRKTVPGADDSPWRASHKERQAIAILLVKAFFGPLMLTFSFAAIPSTAALFDKLGALREAVSAGGQMSLELVARLAHHNIDLQGFDPRYAEISEQAIRALSRVFWDNLYLFSLKTLFLIDTLLFSLGYFWEAGWLKNRVRSVDVTALGVLSCILAYPPFNMISGMLIHSVPTDMAVVGGYPGLTWLIRGLAVVCVLIYVASTVALFAKASNLTNRGTVSRGPYRWVRHPAYASKTLFWYLTALPFFFPATIHPYFNLPNPWTNGVWMAGSLAALTLLYYVRAVTEERHLLKDPEYQSYYQRVKYRFMPGLF